MRNLWRSTERIAILSADTLLPAVVIVVVVVVVD
jgi:hypothetical protein